MKPKYADMNSNLMGQNFSHNIRIRLARLKIFLLRSDNKKKIQLAQSYSYTMRKVWYHHYVPLLSGIYLGSVATLRPGWGIK